MQSEEGEVKSSGQKEIAVSHLATLMVENKEQLGRLLSDTLPQVERKLCICANESQIRTLTESTPYVEILAGLKSRGVRIELVTEINEDNFVECQSIVRDFGIFVRHTDQIRVGFAVADDISQCWVSSIVLPEKDGLRQNDLHLVWSCVPAIVEQNQYLFNILWSRGLIAEQRISEIEKGTTKYRTRADHDPQDILVEEIDKGIQMETFRVIGNPAETQRTFLQMLDSAREEIMILFPTKNAYYREQRFGAIDLLERKASESGVKVRIIGSHDPQFVRQRVGSIGVLKVDLPMSGITGTILIVDSKASLAIELKEDSQSDFAKAIGFATYSTSDATVRIHRSFFEALWHESELKERAERSRREAELLQDILSHDIRNFNQAARLNAELLQEDVTDQSSKAMLSSLINSIDGSTALVERAAKIGRILAVGSNVTHSPVDLNVTIEDSLAIVRKSQPEKEIDFELLGDGEHFALADEMLGEVFVNIFSNAAKYTDGKYVKIEVRIDSVPNYQKITITDHGRGVPEDQKLGLFTRYVKNASGSGLGLSIVHALVVERYRGRIELRNRAEGDYSKGTVVEILLSKAHGMLS